MRKARLYKLEKKEKKGIIWNLGLFLVDSTSSYNMQHEKISRCQYYIFLKKNTNNNVDV